MREMAPFRITICGIDELAGYCDAGVTHLLSILDPGWPSPSALQNFEGPEIQRLHFHDVIEDIENVEPPREAHVRMLLQFGQNLTGTGRPCGHLLVHCHAGISRSSASVAVLLAQAKPQMASPDIAAELLRIRPLLWPNLRIVEFGDRLLRREGVLLAAVREVYRRQLRRDPSIAEVMRQAGRGREVELAMA